MNEPDQAELFGAESDQWSLASVRDADGRYKVFAADEWQKPFLLGTYLSRAPGASPERFEAVWPYVSELTDVVYDRVAPVAIIDSGIMRAHPALAGLILQGVNFTGGDPDDVEDELGHGTNVALLYRTSLLGAPPPHVIVLKVFDGSANADPERLVRALEWIIAYNDGKPPDQQIRNTMLSAGVYTRRYLGLAPCDGHCRLCETARRAAPAPNGMILSAAAGNIAGRTACPACAAFGGDSNIIADASSTERLGRGTTAVPTGRVRVLYMGDQERAQAQLNRADTLQRNGQLDSAVGVLDAVVAEFGERDAGRIRTLAASARSARAHWLLEAGRYDAGLAGCDDIAGRYAADADPQIRYIVATAFSDRGYCLGKLGRNAEAVRAYDQLIDAFETEPATEFRQLVAIACYNKGNALREQGRLAEALSAYDDVLRTFGTATDTWAPSILENAAENRSLAQERLLRQLHAAR